MRRYVYRVSPWHLVLIRARPLPTPLSPLSSPLPPLSPSTIKLSAPPMPPTLLLVEVPGRPVAAVTAAKSTLSVSQTTPNTHPVSADSGPTTNDITRAVRSARATPVFEV